MRITVIDVEHDDAAAAIAAIHAALGARSNGRPATYAQPLPTLETPAIEAPKKKKTEEEVELVELSPKLVDTWNWLVANDTPRGVALAEIAVAMNLAHATTTWRLNALIKKQMAYRVRRGRYRAGERR